MTARLVLAACATLATAAEAQLRASVERAVLRASLATAVDPPCPGRYPPAPDERFDPPALRGAPGRLVGAATGFGLGLALGSDARPGAGYEKLAPLGAEDVVLGSAGLALLLAPQLIPRVVDLLVHLGLRRLDDTVTLLVRARPRLFHDRAGARLRLVEDLTGLPARLFHHRLDAGLRLFERPGALVRGGESFGDLRLDSLAAARWMPDGRELLLAGRVPGGRTRLYSLHLEDGAPPRPIGHEFDPRYDPSPWMRLPFALSHDGRLAAVALATGGVRLSPLDGSKARDLAGAGTKSRPIQWAPDGSKLYVLDATEIPARVFVVDATSGRRQLVHEIQARDSSGVYTIENVALTPDGAAYAYDYQQFQSDLYVVDGLR